MKGWHALYAIIGSVLAALALFFSCNFEEGSDPESAYFACNQPDVKRCNEATGDNPGFGTKCAGDPYAECPKADRVGSCLLNGGTKTEVTIFYYEGHADAGKTDCEVQQQLQGGVYSAESD